jgi:hypothetical protein
MILGTAMILAWTFVIGIGGFFLLAATAYALLTQNHPLAFLSILGLCTPLLLTLGWKVLNMAEMMRNKRTKDFNLTGPTWCERRRPFRVIYQAFFL